MSRPNIIAGKYRGKKIDVLDSEGLRPTSSRIRETLFNWLQRDIQGLRTLDLFSGSGLLSFEALSRGAKESTLIEKDALAFKTLKKNAAFLRDEAIIFHCEDALTFIEKRSLKHYDLLFIDPPFSSALYEQVLISLKGKLTPGTFLYMESPVLIETLPFGATCLKQKKTGQVFYALFQVGE